MPAGHYYDVGESTDYYINHNDGYPAAQLLNSVKQQELQFEKLTRELEAERASVAHKVDQCRIGSETESMNSISSTDDTFQWGGPQSRDADESLRFGDESHGLMDSCLQELENRRTMNFGEDNMNYMPEDSYHSPGHGSYGEQNPYGGMNGGPGSVHSSRVSLHSNSSNRPRQMKMNSRENLGSKSSLPHDQHTDNYAPYSSLQRNYDDGGSPLPLNGSPRSPDNPTRFNQYYDDYGDSYRRNQPAFEPHSDYGGHDSFENPMQQQHQDSPSHLEPFRVPVDDRYAGNQSFEDDRYRGVPQVEDSFYRQSPMLDERYQVPPDRHYHDREPLPQDNYMDGPDTSYRGDEESFRGQGHPDDRYHDGGQPVDRYGPPLNESYGGVPEHHPVNQYGQPLNESYRGPGDESFGGQPPQDGRFRDYNDDGYKGHPNDRYSEDQRQNESFQDPHSNSFQGQSHDSRYNDYSDDPHQLQQEHDLRHEGLPQVQDDPFADDPFRQKQRSLQQLQQLREDDQYPRGPSPGAGSDRMGPGGYPEQPTNFDHMDGHPPYEEDSRQDYGDDGPRSYMEDGLMPVDARQLHAPPDRYPDEGRLTPSPDGPMRWRSPDLQEVIDYLSHPSEAIKGNAAAYLTHLSYMDDDAKQKIRGLDGIPLLVDLLNSDYPEVHKNACGALKNLSYGKVNDENKRAVRNSGGIPSLVRLLRKTQDEDVKDYVTGVLWNLSSCDDLKKPIIDDGVAVLVNVVIIPHSGWEKRALSPYQVPEPWTTVFRNATGILRNVSSAGIEARKKLRECHGLVESLIFSLRTAIDQNNIDNKPVENCVCTLRNLAFRIQEVEDPDFYKKRTATLQRQKKEEKEEKPGCFGGGGKKKGPKGKAGQTPDLMQQPRLPPGANEYKGLWGVDTVRYYLSLLTGSNPVTLEAACGAIQNLAACDWKFAGEVRALVRKEKGLPSLVDLLTHEVERVVGAAATALRNLSIDERNKELVGKYATKQLISNLPQENRPKDITDETLCAVLACLNEVLSHNQDYARQFLIEEGVPRLLFMTRQQHKYQPRTIKYVAAVLKMLWKFKVLHNEYLQKGFTERDFNPPVLSAGGGSSNPSSNFSTPYNTMSRPKDGQGYDDTTLRSRGGYPSNSQMTGTDPRMYQGHSNPALSHEQPDQYTHGSRSRVDDIAMHDIGPGYAPIDQRNQRNKPPAGGVPIFPHHEHQSPGQEPLYAQVNKKRREEMGEPPSPNHMMLDRGGGQEGADSWV